MAPSFPQAICVIASSSTTPAPDWRNLTTHHPTSHPRRQHESPRRRATLAARRGLLTTSTARRLGCRLSRDQSLSARRSIPARPGCGHPRAPDRLGTEPQRSQPIVVENKVGAGGIIGTPPSPPRPRRTDTRSTWDQAARWPIGPHVYLGCGLRHAQGLCLISNIASVTQVLVTAPASTGVRQGCRGARALNPGWFRSDRPAVGRPAISRWSCSRR